MQKIITYSQSQIQTKTIEFIGSHSDNPIRQTHGSDSKNSNHRSNGSSDTDISNHRSSLLDALLEPDYISLTSTTHLAPNSKRRNKAGNNAETKPKAKNKLYRNSKLKPKPDPNRVVVPPKDIALRGLARNANYAEILHEELDTLLCKKLSCEELTKAELVRLEFLNSILRRAKA